MRMKHGSGRGEATSAKPRLLAAFTAVAMMFATAVPALMPKTAVADDPEVEGAICTPQDITMGDDTSDAKIDDGIATWVGRDMYVGAPTGATAYNATTAPSPSYAVEAEGSTLVAGKLAINAKKNSWSKRGFRFGIVGFGAQYRPQAGSDSLVVNNTNSAITLTDLNGGAVSALGYNAQGRGWIGTTKDNESNYNAKINGAESAAIGLKGQTPGKDYTDGVPSDSGWRSIYSTSAGSVVSWGQTNPLKTVNINGTPHDYSGNTKTITDLSDTLGNIPATETAKVRANLTAPSVSDYGYVRNKYNSDKKNDDGTAVHIGVKMNFNDSNYKEKLIEFDGGTQNQNNTIVFNVNASDLNSDGANGLVFQFKNIKEGASIVINVKGNQAIDFHNGWRFWWNDVEISNGYVWNADPAVKKAYEQASQAILWNFQNTPKLTIRGGVLVNGQAQRWANTTDEDHGGKHIAGTTQDVAVTVQDDPAAAMIGSILVPRGSFEDHVTTNGRVWVGQDFMMYNPHVAANFPDKVGEGDSSSVIDMDQERHNFPWKGSLRSECSTIAWNKTDDSGNLLGGSTWGVYKSVQDAIEEKNALYPAVKDNDIPSGDWNPEDGKFRVDSLETNARYYIKEMTAPEGYVKSDLIYVIKTTEKGSISNKDIIAVYNADGTPNTDQSTWKLTNVVGGDGTKGIANTRKGGSVQWGKYADGDNSHKGLAGSEWTLTKTGEGGWSQLITDNTKAVESVSLYKDDQVVGESMTVTEGETFNLTAKVMPADATQDVIWSSSDPDAVEVQDGHVTVRHTPTNGQTVVITATTVDTNASGDRIEAHVTLTIQETALQELTLQYNGHTAPSEISATVGNKLTLTATATPATLNNSITWESTDPSVATVDKGVVTPLKAGTTTIWVKCKNDESKWKSVTVKVREAVDPNATVVYFNPTNLNLGNVTPYIRYSVGGTNNWINSAVQMTQYCDGWYSYAVPSQKQIVYFYFTKSATIGDVLYQAENKGNFVANAGVSDVTVNSYNNTSQGSKPSCTTRMRSAAPAPAKDDADAAASLQVFRRARLQTREAVAEQPTYTDANSAVGQFTILNLPAGTYTLKETTAPDGYYLNPIEYTFTIDETGKVTWTGDKKPSIVGDMGWISDVPTEFSWDKIDAGYSESDNVNNGPLAGSKWRLEKFEASEIEGGEGSYKTNISEIEDCQADAATGCSSSDKNHEAGKFTLKGLATGKYRLTETEAPNGYKLPANVYYYFELGATDPGAAVTWNKGTADTWDKQTGSFNGNSGNSVNSNAAPNYRKTGDVYWGKVSSDLDSNKHHIYLGGSAWRVTYTPQNSTEKVTVDITDCVIDVHGSKTGTCSPAEGQPSWAWDYYGAEGRLGFRELPWGTYEMTELKAPDGYYADPDAVYTFTIDKDNLTNVRIHVKHSDGSTSEIPPAQNPDGADLPEYPNQVITNEPGFELPETGGEGNTLIVMFGVALTAISMLGYAVAMRKRV